MVDSIVEQILLPHGVGASGAGGLDLKRQFAAGVGSGGMLVQVRCCDRFCSCFCSWYLLRLLNYCTPRSRSHHLLALSFDSVRVSCVPRLQLLAVKRHYVAAIATIGSSLPQGGASASPLYYAPIPHVSAPLSVLALHGSNDTLCPPTGGGSALLPDDPTGVLLSATASAQVWRRHSGCTTRVVETTPTLNQKVSWSNCRASDDATRQLAVTSYVLEWKEHDRLLETAVEGGLARLIFRFFDAAPPLPQDLSSFSAVDLGRGGHSPMALTTICSGCVAARDSARVRISLFLSFSLSLSLSLDASLSRARSRLSSLTRAQLL